MLYHFVDDNCFGGQVHEAENGGIIGDCIGGLRDHWSMVSAYYISSS